MIKSKSPTPGQSFFIRPDNQKGLFGFPKKPKPKPRTKKALMDFTGFDRLCTKSKDKKLLALVESIKK